MSAHREQTRQSMDERSTAACSFAPACQRTASAQMPQSSQGDLRRISNALSRTGNPVYPVSQQEGAFSFAGKFLSHDA